MADYQQLICQASHSLFFLVCSFRKMMTRSLGIVPIIFVVVVAAAAAVVVVVIAIDSRLTIVFA